MVEVLNACNVRAACVGNHDLDGGEPSCHVPRAMAAPAGSSAQAGTLSLPLHATDHASIPTLSLHSAPPRPAGVETFVQFAQDCRFPWLMANVIDVKTGKPLAGAQRSVLLDWQGVRLGLMGEGRD